MCASFPKRVFVMCCLLFVVYVCVFVIVLVFPKTFMKNLFVAGNLREMHKRLGNSMEMAKPTFTDPPFVALPMSCLIRRIIWVQMECPPASLEAGGPWLQGAYPSRDLEWIYP